MSTYSNRLQPCSSPKPVITCCPVLPPEIVMHDAYIGGRSENNIKCVVVHNDLGRKNRTTRYNCRFSAASLVLRVIFSVSCCGTYSVLSRSPSIIVKTGDALWTQQRSSGVCYEWLLLRHDCDSNGSRTRKYSMVVPVES